MTGPMLQPTQRWWDGDGDDPSSVPVPDGMPSRYGSDGGRTDVPARDAVDCGRVDGSSPAGESLEAVADVEPDDGPRDAVAGGGARRMALVAGVCSLAVIPLVAGGLFAWRAVETSRAREMRSSCLEAVSSQSAAWESVSEAVAAAGDAEGIDASQVQDASSVSELARLLDSTPEEPAADACPADAAAELLAAHGERADSQTEAYGRYAKELKDAASAVLASRDAKTLADAAASLRAKADRADALLKDSDGGVRDDATRDALRRAVDRARTLLDANDDAGAMNDASTALDRAMAAVNDSVKARQDADARAAAEAQAAQQPQRSYTPSYSGGGYRPSGGHSSGSSGGSPSPSGSSGGWDVPVPSDGDVFGGTDPSL
ncbi:hypothetical protein [Bifidobacterium tsurumiense]|uniref:hypothetical protein n=1 Tax=Bifidobacterium tsurumiense TaxID=356829 RepID=UPI00068572BF|nr:hypothetical protein [Bifidobacterium tsurumiense]